MAETIFGYIERITYYNEENGFVVAKIQEKGKKNLTPAVGYSAKLTPGESINLKGHWINNKKHGEQFQFENYNIIAPATVSAIEKYLGSGLIKGIGPVMAKRIVSKFKEDSFDVIEKTPDRLAEVEGIGENRVESIKKAWEEQKEVKDIMIFLQEHNVGPSFAAKIYKQYGQESIGKIKNNPYQLASDIYGIGFLTADKIAQSLGIPPDSLLRVKEGTVYVLNKLTDSGHMYYPMDNLITRVVEALEINNQLAETAINELCNEDRAIVEEKQDEKLVYLKSLYMIEKKLAQNLLRLREYNSSIREIDTEKAIKWAEEKLGIEFAQQQKQAIASTVQNKITVITGGPGTGKTTIINAVLEILKAIKSKVILTAPTGRAAKRMNEATNFPATTIHRLLKYKPNERKFKHDQDNPLDTDTVIIDEASMIDAKLMNDTLKAIPSCANLVLIGDINQLPSVGPGDVLKNVINSKQFKTVTLNEIFRQSKASQIVTNAHKINMGQIPVLKNEDKSDFYFVQKDEPEEVVSTILELCKNRIPKAFGFNPSEDIQVLSPIHKSVTGVGHLNIELQKILNPQGKEFIRGNRTYRVGDKVMQMRNNYDKNVFNGDIGKIYSIDLEEQEVVINFGENKVTYDFSEMDEVVLSYATSVHKSQGSEYPVVVIPITMQHYIMLQRNLIYTGVTRGKKLVILVGSKKALAIAVKNNKQQKRFTNLEERLKTEHTS